MQGQGGVGIFADVSIPFRAVTGFEHHKPAAMAVAVELFQSLSGLSLGLNLTGK